MMHPGFFYPTNDPDQAKHFGPYRFWCKACRRYTEKNFKQEEMECKCGKTLFAECECGSEMQGHTPNGQYCRRNK